ncbi:MAG TPA: bifunctional phosphoribosylaminoimidazolecarboxamide formyltransferase/IMP cyclohydrolase [Chitinophagales bacterium]|nr:bifunctional phosphoribosylaminoimidazolecarboxamide formyltransferase/IMP cyclohydrolase [Chitinophagales bacterium]
MQFPVTIKSALISVYYKDHLDVIIQLLHSLDVQIYSTGGTATFIQNLNVKVNAVEDLTGYPSILGGRVKTLHPKVFGGILGRRNEKGDVAQMKQYAIPAFDLVIVDLYPFEETLKQSTNESEIIEKIDIGGVSLIRAAAKNFKDVLIIASKNDYSLLTEILENQKGESSIKQRKDFAAKAFQITTAYDNAIASYLTGNRNAGIFSSFGDAMPLRYGENPHQAATFFGDFDAVFEKLNGKEISFNNLVDVESAVYLMEDMHKAVEGNPCFAILKHTNTCGLATGESLSEAYHRALAADPVSAFGGVLIANREIDIETANAIHDLFFEVLIAPSFADEAIKILTAKKNRILLKQQQFEFPLQQVKSLLNGVLVQDRNKKLVNNQGITVVTDRTPTKEELNDLLFAEIAVKHIKSNGIALVKNRQLIAMGVGQTSRVDALKQAIAKANAFGFETTGAVMASEAFFPFPDCVEIAFNAGITAVIQPGGSVKDKDSIDYCNAQQMTMVLTGIRHFKH